MLHLKRLWDVLTRLSLSIWLLIASSLMMFVNSLLASSRPLLYHDLNTKPIWTWLEQTQKEDMVVFIAMILMILILSVLALNTFACTIKRLVEIHQHKGKKWKIDRTIVNWAPTLMHILFFLVLAGHMITFSMGRWQMHTGVRGQILTFSSELAPLQITGFSRVTRQRPGPLNGSTIAHRVELLVEGRSVIVSELDPLRLPNGDWLFLMPPQQKLKKGRNPEEAPVDCSLEERHVKPIPFNSDQFIRFKQVFDPGAFFLFIGFGLILVLMTVYYIFSWNSRR